MSLEELSPEDRQALQLGKLTKQLLQNPETAESVQRLLPKADPKLRFPEVELKDNLAKIQADAKKDNDELREELRKERAARRLEQVHAKIREAGLEVKPVIELMEKHGLPSTDENYDMAIEVLRSRAALAEPTTSDIKPMEMPNIKEMWQDPVKWREQEAAKVLKELRGGRVVQ